MHDMRFGARKRVREIVPVALRNLPFGQHGDGAVARARLALRALALVALLIGLDPPAAHAAPSADPKAYAKLIATLNDDSTVKGTDEIKCYKVLFDAYLKLPKPPLDIGESFNLATIHPKMNGWEAVSAWAEGAPDMAKAIIQCRTDKKKKIIGLPYGEESVDAKYREAGLVVAIGVGGNLRDIDFKYLGAVETIAAYATAETYRLMEAGKVEEGLDLAVAHLFTVRLFCDRRFIAEVRQGIQMLNDALSNLRDVFHVYLEKISAPQYREICHEQLPHLMLIRRRLVLPEGDRIVAEALIRSVFDAKDQPIEEAFSQVFGAVQAAEEPLTLFGAVQRWKQIGRIHSSLPATLKRLELVYDDWWRRWQLLEYDPVLEYPTEFERLNTVRYAAVAYSLDPIESLFPLRNQLFAAINGTAMAGGLCAYKRTFGTFPNDREKIYAEFVRKGQSDVDPYDLDYGTFLYRQLTARTALDTPRGRLWLEPKMCILYARGDDHTDDQAKEHTDNGASATDLVLWPAIKALQREQGLLD